MNFFKKIFNFFSKEEKIRRKKLREVFKAKKKEAKIEYKKAKKIPFSGKVTSGTSVTFKPIIRNFDKGTKSKPKIKSKKQPKIPQPKKITYQQAYNAVYNKFLSKTKEEVNLRTEAFSKSVDYLPGDLKKKAVKDFKKNIIQELKSKTSASYLNLTFKEQLDILKKKKDDSEALRKIYKRYTSKELKEQYLKNIEHALNELNIPENRKKKILENIRNLNNKALENYENDIEELLDLYDDSNYYDRLELILQRLENI